MITAITLNAAIDQIYEIPSMTVGGVNRVVEVTRDAGGKGMNVAKVIQALGAPVDVGGFAGGSNGKRIEQCLKERSIPSELIQISSESRVCLTVLDDKNETGTEFLESGPVISKSEWASMLYWLEHKSKRIKWFALSGSLPQGVPVDAYAEMIHIIHANGAKAVLDTSGEALQRGIKAKPFAIKPNEQEITSLLGKNITCENDLLEAGRKFVASGIEHACFSLGGAGAIFVNRTGSFKIAAPQIDVVNSVGSGDAFVGGLLYGFTKESDLFTTYKRAVACGAVNAMHREIGFIQTEMMESIMSELTVQQI